MLKNVVNIFGILKIFDFYDIKRFNVGFALDKKTNSQEQVKRYILEQEGKDVFEYDIFNYPKELKGQLKIGDFTK